MKDANELNLEVERIKSNIELVKKDIEVIKNNHLYHIEQDVRELNGQVQSTRKMLWSIVLILVTQLGMTVRYLLVGV